MECTYIAKLERKKSLLRAKERERTTLVTADVWEWVYRGTMYSTKGTTWSGSPLWKEAQQEVWHHWFINSYIAAYTAYIQVPYRVDRVHPTGLTVNQGCRQLSTCSTLLSWPCNSMISSSVPSKCFLIFSFLSDAAVGSISCLFILVVFGCKIYLIFLGDLLGLFLLRAFWRSWGTGK